MNYSLEFLYYFRDPNLGSNETHGVGLGGRVARDFQDGIIIYTYLKCHVDIYVFEKNVNTVEVLGRLGIVFGASWVVLGASWASLEASWTILG